MAKKKTNNSIVPVEVVQKAESDAALMSQQAEAIQVTTTEQEEQAYTALTQIKQAIKTIEDKRKENHRDAVNHGTHVGCKIGENHPAAKLTNQNVKEIICKYETGLFSQRKLANIYGVCFTTINAVLTKRNWKYI